jgi:hypothetical protein
MYLSEPRDSEWARVRVTSDLFRWCDSLPYLDDTAKSSTRKPHKKVRFWHFSVVIASRDVRASVRSGLRRSHDWRGMGGTIRGMMDMEWKSVCASRQVS